MPKNIMQNVILVVDQRYLPDAGEYYSRFNRGKREYYYFSEEDMLAFVSKLKDGISGIYLLSAIEIRKHNEHTNTYLSAFIKEMARTLNNSDVVILAGGTDDFFEMLGPENYNFQRATFPDEQKGIFSEITARVYMKT